MYGNYWKDGGFVEVCCATCVYQDRYVLAQMPGELLDLDTLLVQC